MKKKLSRILGVGLTLGLLTSLMVGAAPASALNQPRVTIVEDEEWISLVDPDYVIRFTLDVELVTAGDVIIITFPDGYEIAQGDLTASVGVTATTGWIGGVPEQASDFTLTTWAGDEDDLTITGTLGAADQVGEGADIRVAISAGITNPSTPGTYTLTVETTEEDDAVTSGSFAITVPDVAVLPGVVEVYNPDGHLMASDTGPDCIGDMIAVAGEDFLIEVGPGRYSEADLTIAAGKDGLTIVATSPGWATVVTSPGGFLNILSEDVTIDGLMLEAVTILVSADDATIENCIFGWSWMPWAPSIAIVIDAADVTVTGNTFLILEEPYDAASDMTIGVHVGASGLGAWWWGTDASVDGALISGNSFEVDEDRFCIVVGASVAADDEITIEDNTFSGNSGTGIVIAAGLVDISGDNTWSGLAIGLLIAGGTVAVTDATISQCGTAAEDTPLDPADGTPAIAIADGIVSITNSDITNSPDYAIVVEAAADSVDIMFNTISGNLLNIYSGMVGTVNATHNWWGVATGPADDTIVGLNDTTLVDTDDFLGDIAAGTFDMTPEGGDLDAEAEAGVTVETTLWTDFNDDAVFQAPLGIGVANYAENPQAATPEPALEGGFYDVFVFAPREAAEIVIRFYNPNITENTVIYVWGTLAGGWVPCAPEETDDPSNQGVNMSDGFAYVRVTTQSTPSLGDLMGTPFALCEPPVEIAAPASVLPILGAAEVSLTPTLTWEAVDDATSYELEVAADSTFATVDYSADSVVNGHLVAEDLDYGTTYYWRVRTISDTLTSSWSAGSMFTTVAEEPEPEIELPEIVFPAIGAMGVTNEPTYSWEAVAGADHYDFEVAEDMGLLTKDDPFAMLDYSTSCLINAHAAKEALKLESSYYWRVRTVIDLEEGVEVGSWVTGYFTVMGEPEEAEPPIVVEEITPVTPEITIEPVVIPPQEVIIEIAPDEVVQVIPDYLLWIIVVVGAVLISAVIVLRVRTRRVA